MNKHIGFIGCGNMAKAMISGLLNSETSNPEYIMASNRTIEKLDKLRQEYDIQITLDNKEAARFADILVLAVKPNKFEKIISEIRDSIKDDAIIVSIAAGINIATICRLFQKSLKVVRTMPNIPAVVGEAMTGLCYNEMVQEDELQDVLEMLNSFGDTEVLDEESMNVVTAVSASSPALVYMFIEALADGAVLKGLPRDKAYKMVSQAVLGAAKMVIESGNHPGQLKDRVCSSGGTAIEAIYSLEKKGFRGNVIESIERCTEKAAKIGKMLNSVDDSTTV